MPDELKMTGRLGRATTERPQTGAAKTTREWVTGKSGERRLIEFLWRPECGLRFRERGDHGPLLEQLFIGTAFGQPTRTEWRPVPVVPESESENDD